MGPVTFVGSAHDMRTTTSLISPSVKSRPYRVILGKVPASALAMHPISLPRAANDSLQARISGGRMTHSGRELPIDPNYPKRPVARVRLGPYHFCLVRDPRMDRRTSRMPLAAKRITKTPPGHDTGRLTATGITSHRAANKNTAPTTIKNVATIVSRFISHPFASAKETWISVEPIRAPGSRNSMSANCSIIAALASGVTSNENMASAACRPIT